MNTSSISVIVEDLKKDNPHHTTDSVRDLLPSNQKFQMRNDIKIIRIFHPPASLKQL
jgi:hypothetical protein